MFVQRSYDYRVKHYFLALFSQKKSADTAKEVITATTTVNIVQCTRALVRMPQYTPDAIAELRRQLEQAAVLTERDWLLEKIAYLCPQ